MTVPCDACSVRRMTVEEAERSLTEWATVSRSRDDRVRAAVVAGVSKHRVHVLTGLGRNTVDRILAVPVAGHSALDRQGSD